jgi:hypothetical protein
VPGTHWGGGMNEVYCLAQRPFLESTSLYRSDQTTPAGCAELAEEIGDFIARCVLGQDAQFFDG